MLIDGWSPHEIVWKIVDGNVRVDKISYRSVSSTKVKVDDVGDIEYYEQSVVRPGNVGPVVIPNDKVLHFVQGYEWNPIFGRSMFLQPYYHYENKHKLYFISHIAAQIRALRIRLIKAKQGTPKAKIEEFAKEVAKLGFNSTLNVPENFEVEFAEIGSDNVDLLPLIHHHDVQMSKAVLSQVIDVGVEDTTGSYNLSSTHLDIFITNLELIAKYISNILNRDLIPKLIDWNFGTGNYPKVDFNPFDREDRKFLQAVFVRIVGARKTNVTREFEVAAEEAVSDILKLDIDYENIRQRDIDRAQAVADLEEEKMRAEIKSLEESSQNNNGETGGQN